MMTTKSKAHYVHQYLLSPYHPVTINLIGVGGTGSMVLSHLARMNHALMALGHRGIYVVAYDGDIVTAANMGRQMFSEADLGQSKAAVLVSRINRYFGYNWKGIPENWPASSKEEYTLANITISCVDTVRSRREIATAIKKLKNVSVDQTNPIYQLDFGNALNTGQVLLSTVKRVNHPEEAEFTHVTVLPGFLDIYKKAKDDPADNEPSCSLAEALERQDLFINPVIATYGCQLLWKMFREGRIDYHGVYVNLSPINISTVPIP